jgi:hypothetical protein
VKSIPPPQPLMVVSPETVVLKPSLTRVPVGLLPVPVTYVANAPISNSLGLKYSGGGAGVITCFEDTTGSPAKATTACDATVTTAKASLFIRVVFIVFELTAFSFGLRLGRRGHRIAALEGKSIKFNQTFLLYLSPIGSSIVYGRTSPTEQFDQLIWSADL